MKIALAACLGLVAAAMLFLVPVKGNAQVVAGEEHCVVGVAPSDRLNLRARPSSRAAILASLGYRACGVIVTGPCRSGWCPVKAAHQAGWADQRFLSMISPALYCVSGLGRRPLDLRAWPAERSRKLVSLPANQCGIALLPHTSAGWQKIRVAGWEGWVRRDRLSGQ